MKKLFSFFLLSACLIIFSCDTGTRTEDRDTDVTTEQDQQRIEDDSRDFVKTAASSGRMEVELGKLAQEKAQDQQVKDFAQKLVNEHQQANNKLKNIASNQNINVPQQMKDDHKNKVEDLREKSGQEFDKEYMDIVVNAHEDDISEFEDAQDDVKNQELKSWISSTLPNLRNHLEEAKRIQDNLENKNQ